MKSNKSVYIKIHNRVLWGEGIVQFTTADEASKEFGKVSSITSLFWHEIRYCAGVYLFFKDAWDYSGVVLIATSSDVSKLLSDSMLFL